MYFNITKDIYLENCKIKWLTKKLICATYKIDKYYQTKNYEFISKLGKIYIVKEISLKKELENIKYGNNK